MNERLSDQDHFLREPEVRRITGLSRTTRWRLQRDGKFPLRRQISANAVGWLASEINAWMPSRQSSMKLLMAGRWLLIGLKASWMLLGCVLMPGLQFLKMRMPNY